MPPADYCLEDAIALGIKAVHNMIVNVTYEGNGVFFITMIDSLSQHGRECLLLLGDTVDRFSNAVVVPPEMTDQLLLTYAPAHYAPNCGLGM